MVLMIRTTCTPHTGVRKKWHDHSQLFCLCLSIQLSHVIALFLSPFCHKVSFLCSKTVSNNFAHIPPQKKKIKKILCEGIVNMFCSIDFDQRNQEPQLVLFNHIKIELLDCDIITCSNFDLTEKKFRNNFCKERKKRSFRNASSPKKNCLYGIHLGAEFVWNELYLLGGPIQLLDKKNCTFSFVCRVLNEKRKKEKHILLNPRIVLVSRCSVIGAAIF